MKKLFPYLVLIFVIEVSASTPEHSTRTLVWSDGTRYVGGVLDGKRSGKGTIFWQDGTRFVGEFENDKRNGPGTMIMPDGTIYSGIFSNDQLIEATEPDGLIKSSDARSNPETTNVPETSNNTIDKTQDEIELTGTVQDPEASDTIILIPERKMPEIADDPYAPVTILTPRIRTEVQEMVNLWGAAWSEQNVPQYLSNYSDEFVITAPINRREWEALRRERLTRPRFIDIQIFHEGMEVTAEDTIEVLFTQTYRSNLYRDSTRKILRIKREVQGWQNKKKKIR